MTWFHSGSLARVRSPLRLIELFAGDGAVGKSCRYAHIATAMLDINMTHAGKAKCKTNAFDLTTSAGLALLACNC